MVPGGCSSAPTLLQGEPRVLHVKGKAKQGKESLLETQALVRQCLKTGTKPKGRFKDRESRGSCRRWHP